MLRLWLPTLLCLLVTGCLQPPSPEELARADYGPQPREYRAIIKEHMKYILKDPESAQYEVVKGPAQGWSKTFDGLLFGYAVCVGINAKNSFGGYVGMKMYYFLIHNNTVIRRLGDNELEQAFVIDACAKL